MPVQGFFPLPDKPMSSINNVNLQVAAVNLANLPECLKSYANLIVGLIPCWQENAERLYGMRGVLSGTRTTGRENQHTHHNRGFPGFFWTAGAQWLTLPLIEYYEVSSDRDFLENTLYGLIEQIALFYEDFLTVTDDRGSLVFVPSYSPENRPANLRTTAVINATMDIAVAKEALSYAIKFSKELGRNKEKISDWQKLLDKLPRYRVNEDGALAEWADKDLRDRYNHRHVSHLYPLWPGHEISPESGELFEAALMAARKRGRGNRSAHGLAHMALIGSRLRDCELVYGNLDFMLRENYILPSLFTWHNPGRIYNADMLHSLPGAVMEMLVYSRPGEIEFFPALSDKLSRGSIKGVQCRVGVSVEELIWDFENKRAEAVLRSIKDQEVTLRYRRGMNRSQLTAGETTRRKFSSLNC